MRFVSVTFQNNQKFGRIWFDFIMVIRVPMYVDYIHVSRSGGQIDEAPDYGGGDSVFESRPDLKFFFVHFQNRIYCTYPDAVSIVGLNELSVFEPFGLGVRSAHGRALQFDVHTLVHHSVPERDSDDVF